MKILIVEDNAIQALLLQKLVAKLGYTNITLAYNYPAALEKATSIKPDLMLVDVNLDSDKNGIDLVKEIQKDYDVTAVYITGNSDAAHRAMADETNCAGYLVKPIDIVKFNSLMSDFKVDSANGNT